MGLISHMSVDFPEKRKKEEIDKKKKFLFKIHIIFSTFTLSFLDPLAHSHVYVVSRKCMPITT